MIDPIMHKITRMLITGRFKKNPTQFLVLVSFTTSFFLSGNSALTCENHKYITGSPIHVTKKEQTRVITMVFVSTLKYAPATPPRSMNGTKITMVLIDDPTIDGSR